MRISIREALFGGEEVDDWEPPKSEWILIKKAGASGWTKEFINMPKPGLMEKYTTYAEYTPTRYCEVNGASQFEVMNSRYALAGNSGNFNYWYLSMSAGEDFILFSNQNEEQTNKAKQMIEENDFKPGIYLL